jgi:hypothetical protein
MNRNRLFIVMLLLALPGCTHQAPQVAAPAPAPVEPVMAPPRQLQVPAAGPAIDPATLVQAQAYLRALGYPAGKSGDANDPAFKRALLAFQKDQGLTEDGLPTPQVMEKLRLLRATLRIVPAAPPSGLFVYSGSSSRHALTLTTPPDGFASDAPANFLMPLRAGGQASLHLTRKGAAPVSVACRVGKVAASNLALGIVDTVSVDCHGEGAGPQWHDLFSPRLGVVVQREMGAATRELIAIRPVTGGWPLAARLGLDWALSHALDDPAPAASLQWSSTGVAPHFDVKATTRVKGGEMGLGGTYAAALCRRFELVQTGSKNSYPGIACQNGAGDWVIPNSGINIARPAGHANPGAPSLRSAAN